MTNKCQLVRDTCKWVVDRAQHVTIHPHRIPQLAQRYSYRPFNSDPYHKTQSDPQTALLQLFMLDAMNFCFWPIHNFEYEQLATHVQTKVKEGVTLQELTQYSKSDVIDKIFHGIHVPLADERARILREMSSTVLNTFNSSFVSLVTSANKSAVALLNILTTNFPNFQDHSIYQGHQIHFYKRAQILIGDIFGKFNGKDLGQFTDIDQLTMFPDYRVPQILEAEGVLQYSEKLKNIIMSKQVITDREIEAELRASTVVAVERMKQHLIDKGIKVISIQLDWFLWQLGEDRLSQLPPHHRCLTIYY